MSLSAGVGRSRRLAVPRGASFGFLRLATARVGVAGVLLVVLIALLGPVLAPHSPTAPVAAPLTDPNSSFPLGTDLLGRDGLSRVLSGGRTVIGLALAATAISYLLGLPAGLFAGYSRSWLAGLVMRVTDVLLAFPPILFLLVIATGTGSNAFALVATVGVIFAPGLARIIRAASLEVVQQPYVEAAVARGEGGLAILRREILPNIAGVILADFGIRLTYCILLTAVANFLGFGLQPPTADWALMVAENRGGITLQPWVVIAPALMIAVFTLSINLVADAVARGLGTSLEALEGAAAR